jgi:hypothetical protein
MRYDSKFGKQKKIYISKELYVFLKCDRITTRLDCENKVVDYILKNNLQSQKKIHPNKKLSNLLQYEDYIQRVLNGRVAYQTINSFTHETSLKIENNVELTWDLLSHLLSRHYNQRKNLYNQAQEDVILLKIFLNGRTPHYSMLEILERFDWSFGFKTHEIFEFISHQK